MDKPNTVLRVDTPLESFFTRWLLFLRPLHGMTDRQISLAAQFLRVRHELSKKVTDEGLLDENVMSDATRKKVREACGLSQSHFQVLIGDLRKHRFFVNGKINPQYIPKTSFEDGYSLLILFNIVDSK